jgi:signal transduction histidine kinase
VLDDGRGAPAVNGEASGHGLIGMRERVALFGGSLTARSRNGDGYEVRARIPFEAPAA